MKIGRRTYSTKQVSLDTLTAWIDSIERTEGADHNLVTTFHDDIQPAFIPAYDGITLSQLALIAIVFFVLICIFFPKKLFTFDLFSDKIPMANSVKKIFEEKKH